MRGISRKKTIANQKIRFQGTEGLGHVVRIKLNRIQKVVLETGRVKRKKRQPKEK